MRHQPSSRRTGRTRRAGLAAVGLLAAFVGGPAQVQAAPPAAVTVPAAAMDLSGVWFTEESVGFGLNGDPGLLREPYRTRFLEIQRALAEGRPTGDQTANCVPPGMPRVMFAPYPLEILQTAGQVTVIFEYMGQIQRIYTDGRPHPDDLDPSFMGHSIGRWADGALVAETVGLNPATQLDASLAGHGAGLRLVQRLTREGDRLIFEVTAHDDEALARPVTARKVYTRRPDLEILEYACAENNRNRVDADGVTQYELRPGG